MRHSCQNYRACIVPRLYTFSSSCIANFDFFYFNLFFSFWASGWAHLRYTVNSLAWGWAHLRYTVNFLVDFVRGFSLTYHLAYLLWSCSLFFSFSLSRLMCSLFSLIVRRALWKLLLFVCMAENLFWQVLRRFLQQKEMIHHSRNRDDGRAYKTRNSLLILSQNRDDNWNDKCRVQLEIWLMAYELLHYPLEVSWTAVG